MDIFSIAAKISLDTSDFTSGIKKVGSKMGSLASTVGTGIGKVTSAVGTGIKKVGEFSVGAVTAGATAISALIKQSVDAYASYEQLVGGMETLFKDSSDVVIRNAQNAYQTAGMSANEYMETTTQFAASLLKSLDGDTAKAAQYSDKAIRQMSDNVNKMGTNVEMVQNAYRGFARGNFTMLDNLSLGFAGTKTGMEELLAKAKELSEQQGEYREFSIDSFADIVDAIGLVQDAMGITGTTAKEAAGTISGSVASAKAAWKNFATELGKPDGDVQTALNTLMSSVATAAGNIAPVVEDALDGLITIITEKAPDIIGDADKGTGIIGAIKKGLPKLSSTASSLVKAVTDKLPDFITAIAAIAPDVLTAVGNIFSSIMTAIPESMNKVTELLTNDNGELVKMVNGAVDALAEQIPQIMNAGFNLFGALLDKAPEIVNHIVSKFPDLIGGIVGNVDDGTGLLGQIPKFVNAGLDMFSNLLNNENVYKVIDNLGEQIPKLITGIIGNAEDGTGIAGHIPEIIQGGLDLMSHLLDNVPAILAAIGEGLGQLVVGIGSALADPKTWEKAGNLLLKAGEAIVNGIVAGILNFGGAITDAIGSFLNPFSSKNKNKNGESNGGNTVGNTVKNVLGVINPFLVPSLEAGYGVIENFGKYGFNFENWDVSENGSLDAIQYPDEYKQYQEASAATTHPGVIIEEDPILKGTLVEYVWDTDTQTYKPRAYKVPGGDWVVGTQLGSRRRIDGGQGKSISGNNNGTINIYANGVSPNEVADTVVDVLGREALVK